MSGAGGGFFSVAHCRASVVIFVEKCGGLLWYVEVPKNTANIEHQLSCVAGSHKFGFCTRASHNGLELAFVRNHATGKPYADTTKRLSSSRACGPVQISKGMCNKCVKLWATVENDVVLITVDDWCRTFG